MPSSSFGCVRVLHLFRFCMVITSFSFSSEILGCGTHRLATLPAARLTAGKSLFDQLVGILVFSRPELPRVQTIQTIVDHFDNFSSTAVIDFHQLLPIV